MIKIEYSFYNDYNDNALFKKTLDKRIHKIKKDIQENVPEKYININNIIEDYFVEIFSWSVLPKCLLLEIDMLIQNYTKNYTIIDPCSGNSFHTFLFNNFCNINVITIDIQVEDSAWIDTFEGDGLFYMQNKINSFEDKVLLLSWIDYDDLTVALLKSYKGQIVISIGNYDETNSKKYLHELNNNYLLLKHYELKMPWNSIENCRIYKKINN